MTHRIANVAIIQLALLSWLTFVCYLAHSQSLLYGVEGMIETNPYDEEEVLLNSSTNTSLLDECLVGLAMRRQVYSWSWFSEMHIGDNGNAYEKTVSRRVSPPDEFERIRLAQLYLSHGANPNATLETTETIREYSEGNVTDYPYAMGDTIVVLALRSGYERLASVVYNSTNSNHVLFLEQNKREAVRFARNNFCFLFLSFIGERVSYDLF